MPKAFQQQHPDIEVYVMEKPDPEIEQELIERRIEFGVVTLPKTRFDTLALVVDELVAVLPGTHELAWS